MHAVSLQDDIIWEKSFKNTPIKSKYKIVILKSKDANHSVRTFAKKLDKAAHLKNWQSFILDEYKPNLDLINKLQPDFIISLLHKQNLENLKPKFKTYAYLLHATDYLLLSV